MKRLRPPLLPSCSRPPEGAELSSCETRHTSPTLCIRWSRQLSERWSVIHHRVFKCSAGKSSYWETFRLRGNFLHGAEKCKWTFFTEMSFCWRRRRFANCPPTPLHFVFQKKKKKKNPRGGRTDGGKKKKKKKRNTHHIKSDYIVPLMEQFVSQFCQQHALAQLPGGRCLQPCRTIRHRLFYPRCPLTLSARLLIHAHTRYVYNTHTRSGLRW